MSHAQGGPAQQDVYDLNPRLEVLPHIPRKARSALDVGCGRGGFGDTLRTALGVDARIVGVEPVADQAAVAREHGFDEVVVGYFPQALQSKEQFDVITFNDVLEHLVDPWEVLRDTAEHLTAHGVVVAAIPNIQYWPAVLDLANGHFEYTESGLLDRTHLRFFTRKSMCDMFVSSGYEVISCKGAHSVWEAEWRRSGPGLRKKVRQAIKKALVRRRPDGEFLHFVVVARPANGGVHST